MTSAMGAASQLPGRGGPLMWMLPLYLHFDKKSDDDDMMMFTKSETQSRLQLMTKS